MRSNQKTKLLNYALDPIEELVEMTDSYKGFFIPGENARKAYRRMGIYVCTACGKHFSEKKNGLLEATYVEGMGVCIGCDDVSYDVGRYIS